MVNIDAKEIKGPWDKGFVLDRHTISSTMIGYNEFGHPEFDTVRSPLGELVYPLKYKNDDSVVQTIAEALGKLLGVPTDTATISKTKQTPQMKDVGDYSERVAALNDAFTVASGVENKAVLLVDDLFQSGATMTVAANAIKARRAKAVYALALTRTRS